MDALINNAGTAGPKQLLSKIPLSRTEMRAVGEQETMMDATMNLLGGPWNMVRATLPVLSHGASIVNVSTIFSRATYLGRIPYVVPKSALNALSTGLAHELGMARGVRVNTVFPGPIESERIETVFAAMDALQSAEAGTTSKQFKDLMILKRSDSEGKLDYAYPTPTDVASTIRWLSTPESNGFTGHAFEVTNGMQVPAQSRAKLVSWPDNRLVDLRENVILILGGYDYEEALHFAERNAMRGAHVVLGFGTLESVGNARALIQARNLKNIKLQHVDQLRRESLYRVFRYVSDQYGQLDGVVVLPSVPNGEYGLSLGDATDDDVVNFAQNEIVAPVAFASAMVYALSQWPSLKAAPAITFVSNSDDGRDNRLNEVKRAAVEALIRVWRYEDEHLVSKGEQPWSVLPNQLVRYDNNDSENLTFAADWTATLSNRVRKMDPINLWIPKQIHRATGKTAMPMSIQRVLPGLHQGKTAVITGGSLGIGLQLGRFLAIAGARVLLSARSVDKLQAARSSIVEELRGIGYGDPESRVSILPGIDVGDKLSLKRLYDHALQLFVNVDILINNAGIAGAEEMVADMELADWTHTLNANLVSNYSLIRLFAPHMKANGYGSILNVSSYFGGEKYLAVAYPNRADYAVSKAGQRVLAEILSRHLGPEIQINALAPGPVDGARLRGVGGTPGLFQRRGRLILENKRLNQIHAAMLASLTDGSDPNQLLRVASNDLSSLREWEDTPEPLRQLFRKLEGSMSDGSQLLFNGSIARKLIKRLVRGGQFTEEAGKTFLEQAEAADDPLFSEAEIQKAAERIESGIINRLHLHKMPTDEQVGLSTVFHLADDIVSGETFHPSGGLKFDRSVSEGELMLRPGREDLQSLAGKNVVLIGDAMDAELRSIAEGFLEHGVASLDILTHSSEMADTLRHGIRERANVAIDVAVIGDQLEDGLSDVLVKRGRVDVVVSAPFTRLPLNALAADAGEDWSRVLSEEQFQALVNDQLTHHFRIARQAVLLPRCQIVLLTPDTSRASTREEFALALFTKNALHAFTATLGVESERLPTYPAINQVQLTRRARTEEPANEQELAEEMERLVYAVLQCAIPAPKPTESRYLSRIFRGNAVTV